MSFFKWFLSLGTGGLILWLSACSSVQPYASYKPPILPVKLVIQPSGVTIEGDTSIVTPVGTFSVGASLPLVESSQILVVLRNRRTGTDNVYRVTAGRNIHVLTNGRTEIDVSSSGVAIIDITEAEVEYVEITDKAIRVAKLPPTVPAPTVTPVIVIITATPKPPTPSPTSTRLPPTATSIPSATPIPDTRLGTVLSIGDTWRQGGLELYLEKVDFSTNIEPGYGHDRGVNLHFSLTNKQPQDVSISITQSMFSAVDNRGNRLHVVCADSRGNAAGVRCDQGYVLRSGASRRLIDDAWNVFGVFVIADIVADPISAITFTVSGLSSINQAHWRVPIHR